MEQAGTFMHELGHNLGLRHGGGDDVNYKPNFLSIMNYFFQMNGLYKNKRWGLLNYSQFTIKDLDETSLNEKNGLDAVGGDGTLRGGQGGTGRHSREGVTYGQLIPLKTPLYKKWGGRQRLAISFPPFSYCVAWPVS